MEDKMSENKGNRVVVTDSDNIVKRIKTDGEIVKENDELEAELKSKTKKQRLEEILEENKARKKKEKAKKEEEAMTVMLVDKPDRSLNIGILGLGQCGGKLVQEFHNSGYPVVCFNLAAQDLEPLKIPNRYKMLLDVGLGSGAGKNLDIGEQAILQYRDQISKMVEENLGECDMYLVCSSGGGGSGSGGSAELINILLESGKPVSMIYVLPLDSEDVTAKNNSIITLSRLAHMASNDLISSLIIVDNSRLAALKGDLSISSFFEYANKRIVDPIVLFNNLSSLPSEFISFDGSDFSNVFLGGDCLIYGSMTLSKDECLEDESKIAEAMVMNMEENLLASEFDISESRVAGIIIVANKDVLDSIPMSSIEYGFGMANKICGAGTKIYRGLYQIDNNENELTVYSFFAGLGLPSARVEELKAESEKYMKLLEGKEEARSTNMKIDLNKTQAVSDTDKMHKRIKMKNSALGKLNKNSDKRRVIDKRRR